ncbi:MAG: hypothetical protein QM674_12235 [Burkholderiaceae bacterium]
MPRFEYRLADIPTGRDAVAGKRLRITDPDCGSDDAHAKFGVLIVGSGYGGAVAASELAAVAARGNRIAVLERGLERLPGSFPSRFSDLPGEVRFAGPDDKEAHGRATGLFDVRLGPDLGVVVANGVGGGSLINAGVMEIPDRSVFEDHRWPDLHSAVRKTH